MIPTIRPFVPLLGAMLLPAAALAQAPAPVMLPLPAPLHLQVYDVAIQPAAVLPGQAFRLQYAIAHDPLPIGWAEPEVTLVGMPANALAAGTPTVLPSPVGSGIPVVTDVPVTSPAQAGSYSLSLRVRVPGSVDLVQPIGLLTVAGAPARLVDATMSARSFSACVDGWQNATLQYTAEDGNGAGSIARLRITGLQPLASLPVGAAGMPAVPLGGTLTTTTTVQPAPAGPTIVSPAPGGGYAVTSPAPSVVTRTTRTYVAPAAPVSGSLPVLPPGGVEVTPPRTMNLSIETVSTPVTLPCLGPSPIDWQPQLTGYVQDVPAAVLRPLGPVPVLVTP